MDDARHELGLLLSEGVVTIAESEVMLSELDVREWEQKVDLIETI